MRLPASVIGRGSAALLLAAVPVGAPPAYASSPADLAVRISDTAPRGAPGGQVVTATVVNRGPGTASGIMLRFVGRVDSEAVNPEALRFCAPRRSAARRTPPAVTGSLIAEINGSCPLPDLVPGRSHGLRSVVPGRVDAPGTIGEMTVAVGHAGADPAPGDNHASTRLGRLGPAAYRLYARGWDGPADPVGTVGAVPPGGAGDLRFEIGNSGFAPVNGFTVRIRLPHRVAFARARPGCAYGPDRRSATCTYANLPVLPARGDTDPADRSYSALRFRHGFEVDRAAPVRARLDDGLLRVEPLVTGYLPPPVTRLPVDVTGLRARDFDAEDHRDRFAVFTGASVGDGAGQGDLVATSEDGLAVTGAPIGRLGVAGLGLVVAGVLLLLLTRCRAARRPVR